MNKKQRIAKAWTEGWTSREIAVLIGVSTRYVFYVRSELNLSRRKQGRPRKC
jgi:hypothetical protein